MTSDTREPHPAPNESLPQYAARMYDSLGIGDLYEDDRWVERADDEGLPSASALPDRLDRRPSVLDRIRSWLQP